MCVACPTISLAARADHGLPTPEPLFSLFSLLMELWFFFDLHASCGTNSGLVQTNLGNLTSLAYDLLGGGHVTQSWLMRGDGR